MRRPEFGNGSRPERTQADLLQRSWEGDSPAWAPASAQARNGSYARTLATSNSGDSGQEGQAGTQTNVMKHHASSILRGVGSQVKGWGEDMLCSKGQETFQTSLCDRSIL